MDDLERDQRARVVALAREWIGTPYRNQARVKGIGADCTFFAVVYEEAGLIPHVEIGPYSPQAHLHRTAGIYMKTVRDYAEETDKPQPGDIVMYWFGRDFSHGGVVVDPGWPCIVHGDRDAGMILEAMGDQARLALSKEIRFFTLWPTGVL